MRDFYDVYILSSIYIDKIDVDVLKEAFVKVCEKRSGNYVINDNEEILKKIECDEGLKGLWKKYKEKYQYAETIEYIDVIKSIRLLLIKIKQRL